MSKKLNRRNAFHATTSIRRAMAEIIVRDAYDALAQ